MAQVVAHRTLRNSSIGLGGKAYRVDDKGVLHPQPTPEARVQILMLRALHLISEERAAGYHPGLTPPLLEVEDTPAPRTSVAEVLAAGAPIPKLVAPPTSVEPAKTLAPPPPEDSPDATDYASLSRDDLLEIARARGIPGLKGKLKSQLLTLVTGK